MIFFCKPTEVSTSAFGGCHKLFAQYQMIGQALLKYEELRPSYSGDTTKARSSFREDVAFAPLEVLESYLDDLLCPGFPAEKLFITRDSWWYLRTGWWLYLLLIVSIFLTPALILCGIHNLIAITSSLCCATVVIFLISYKYHKALRRLRFAQVLSKEISRRRGRNTTQGEALRAIDLSYAWQTDILT